MELNMPILIHVFYCVDFPQNEVFWLQLLNTVFYVKLLFFHSFWYQNSSIS